MMRIAAFTHSGRMVSYARQDFRGKTDIVWRDSREVGGVYEKLEEWMRIVQLEQGSEVVSFRIQSEEG